MGNYSKYTSDQLQEMLESEYTYQIYLDTHLFLDINLRKDYSPSYIDAYIYDNSITHDLYTYKLLINENDLDYFCDLQEENTSICTEYESTKHYLKFDTKNSDFYLTNDFSEIIVFNRINGVYTEIDESSCGKIHYFKTDDTLYPKSNLTIRGFANGKLCSTSFSKISKTANLYISRNNFNIPTSLVGNGQVTVISPNIIGLRPYGKKIICGNIDDLIEYTDKFSNNKYADATGIVHVYIIDETINISKTKVDKLNSNLHNLFDKASTQFDMAYYTMVDINGNIIKE